MNKEHYCRKIQALLIKSSASLPPSIDPPPPPLYGLPPIFTRKSLSLPSMIFASLKVFASKRNAQKILSIKNLFNKYDRLKKSLILNL